MSNENLCLTCFRNSCMLHPDNKEHAGSIIFKMIECPNHLTDVMEIPYDEDITILFDKVPTGGLTGHLNAIKAMVEEALEDKGQLRDALAEIVYLIIRDDAYDDRIGEMSHMLHKYKDIMAKNDISIE